MRQDWITRFEQELKQAEEARARGNEGMARVCARRAAGIVAGEFLQRRGSLSTGPSAYDRLRVLRERPDLHPSVSEVAGHFLTRINTEGQLPIEADLIAEARWLAKELLE